MYRTVVAVFVVFFVLLTSVQLFAEQEITPCDEIIYSTVDQVMVLPSSGSPGDTIWVPVHMRTDSTVLGFALIINYDHLLLTPIESSPGYVLAEQVGRFAGTDEFLAIMSPNPLDSGAVSCTFIPPLFSTQSMEPGDDVIFKLAFEVSPNLPVGDSTQFNFQVTDHSFGCRISELALQWGDPSNVVLSWPTTTPGWVIADSSDSSITSILDFRAFPRSIVEGGTTDLSFIVVNSDSITISHDLGTFLTQQAIIQIMPNVTTTYELTAFGSEGIATKATTVNVTLPGENQYPMLHDQANIVSPEGLNIEFTITCYDPDGDIPSLSVAPLPSGATLTDSGYGTALFSWIPSHEDIGSHPLMMYATDALSTEMVDSLGMKITVVDVNYPPQGGFDSSPVLNVPENDTIQFLIHAWDPDSTIPSIEGQLFNRDTLAPNMTVVDSGNGMAVFTFVPDYYQGNSNPSHYYVTFTIRDSEDPLLASTTGSKHISVINHNSGLEVPILELSTGPGPYLVEQGHPLTFDIIASTSIGDLPVVSSDSLPRNASLVLSPAASDQEIMEFAFYPDFDQMGDYPVTFYADNNGLVDSLEVLISVVEGNRPPWIYVPSNQPDSVVEDSSLKMLVYADDPDSIKPVLSAYLDGADSLGQNMSFVDSGNGTGVLTFSPNRIQGSFPVPTFYYVRFTATDAARPDVSVISPTVTLRVHESGLPCCISLAGDIDYNGNGLAGPDIRDLTLLVKYLFGSGLTAIPCQLEADCNGDEKIDLQDLTRLVNYLFEHGPPLSVCP
ncbi:MAG: hypothetical protein KOO62_12825 [candidate division Zixibacteria bacterium]|nr:hypothetical protein [candidate division Zixibacteria bacterium]